MPRHFFFDLDNTLTRSKTVITPEHAHIFRALSDRADIIVVSGQDERGITKHLSEELVGLYHVLGQNGNTAKTREGQFVWQRLLSDAQKQAALAFVRRARAHLPIDVTDENDIVDDRGCQIAFSLIGHNEAKEKKEAFDPDHSIRHRLLRELADAVVELGEAGVEVRSGGTTVLDMFEKGKHKGFNVAAYIADRGWQRDACLYIGDALFPGGNDETVIGVIPTHAVKDHHETYQYLTRVLELPHS